MGSASASLVTDAERLRMRDPPPGRTLLRQSWHHLGFLHWPVDPDLVAPVLPAGLEVDTFQGHAYLGVVPFSITGLLSFHEINVRTYVHRGGREPGVWFFSLDAASRLAVAGARVTYRLPYYYAAIEMEVRGPEVATRARRLGRPARAPRAAAPPHFACRYLPTGPVAPASPGTLEMFLAERYLLYSWDGRRLRSARVHHPPYPLQPATTTDLDQTLTADAGFPVPGGPPPLCHYAARVDVAIHAPHLVRPLAP